MKLPHCVETTIHTLFDENGDPKVSIALGREILSPLYRRMTGSASVWRKPCAILANAIITGQK